MTGRQSWGGGQGAGAITTVEQFLMRGLATACQACVVGLPRSDPRRSASPLPKLVEDSPTGANALATASGVTTDSRLRRQLVLALPGRRSPK
jgi:hypothetical protein